MEGTIVIMLAQNHEFLLGQRMKGVGDGDFMTQNPGTMSYLPIAAEIVLQPFIV